MKNQKALAKQLKRSQRGYALARHLTWTVLALLGAAALTLAITDGWTPGRGRLFLLVWGKMHAMEFYPFLAAILIAPLLTAYAWRVRGSHRYLLCSSWALFLTLTVLYFPHRINAMAHVLWIRYGEGVAETVAQVM